MRSPAPHLLAACLATPALAGTPAPPIVGGSPTSPGQYPNVVAVEAFGRLCTGTLITPDWVLTAAHCVSPEVLGLPSQAAVTASVTVHAGTIDLAQAAGVPVRASETIPHPAFDQDALGAHDVGLIRLATPVADIPPARLNVAAANAPIGLTVTKVGFGVTAAGGASGVAYEVDVIAVPCTEQLGSDADLLCFSQVSGRGVCAGDSGSPAFATVRGAQVVVGLTSFVDEDCAEFGADTRIDAERAFLLTHVPEVITCDTRGCADASGATEFTGDGDDGGGCDASGGGAPPMLLGIGALAWLRRRRGRTAASGGGPRHAAFLCAPARAAR